ncbi:hypothetical protein BH23BAC4_BH23BAC4_10520 [soil metagenome]
MDRLPTITEHRQTMERKRASHRGRRISAAIAVGAGAALAPGVLFLTRPFGDVRWSSAPPHDTSIYASQSGDGQQTMPLVVSPFHLDTEPMKRLLLVNFEQDPDRTYLGLEPQAFADDLHGTGLLVLGWRVDGRVDVFHDPALRLEPANYGIAGKGLHQMAERSFGGATFEVGPAGAQVDLRFEDLEGREISIFIRETDMRPRRPFNLLAPMGTAASDPPALPLVYVNDFYFVRKAGTEVRIAIDGRVHEGDSIPLILDGARVHFLRYSADPFIVTWNPRSVSRAAILHGVTAHRSGTMEAEAAGNRYDLIDHVGHVEIQRMTRGDGRHQVVIDFEPAFPHLLALRDEVDVSGRFRITSEPQAGTVVGTWRVSRSGDRIDLELSPNGGWTPGEAPPMARVLFRTVSMFRQWPTTYRWRGSLAVPADAARAPRDGLSMTSRWERLD